MVEPQPSKLVMWVRSPSPAPQLAPLGLAPLELAPLELAPLELVPLEEFGRAMSRPLDWPRWTERTGLRELG